MADRPYRVRLTPSARDALSSLPIGAQRRVVRSMESLESNPRPRGATLLEGSTDRRIWRVRVGDYRVLYEIRDAELVVLVIRIGHRREVYRGR